MQLSLNSIIIFVEDLTVLEHFYVDILNLQVVEKIENQWLLLSAGGMTLGLHRIKEEPEEASSSKVVYHSNTKIIFEVNQDLEVLRTDLLAKQVKLREIVTWDGYDYWLCDGEDPEGNVFQLKQKK